MTDDVEPVPGPESLPKPHPVRNKKFQQGGRPAAYLAFLPGLFALCEEMGYNLMVHGSLCRDFDLCAVAWAHGAAEVSDLVQAVAKHVGGKIQDSLEPDTDPFDFSLRAAEPKIHGRYAWTIHLMSGPQLDLSVVGPEPEAIHKMMRRIEESAAHFQSIWKLPDVGSQEVNDMIVETQRLRGYPASPMAQARIGYEVARRLLIRQGMSNKVNNELFPPESGESDERST